MRRIYGPEREEVPLAKYCYHIREDEMGGTCSIYGRDNKCVKSFGSKT
jgi:hypothetical protein